MKPPCLRRTASQLYSRAPCAHPNPPARLAKNGGKAPVWGRVARRKENMSSESKYVIRATIRVDTDIQRKDVIGAIFGQTEGLLGEGLQLRKLQSTGRISHVDVNLNKNKGRTQGQIELSTSLDQVSAAVIGAALETIDRVGPGKASIRVKEIENIQSA